MNLDLSKVEKVFFVGIGGIGISAIARMMFLEGKDVSGSDISMNVVTEELQKLGVKIILGQGMEIIPRGVELIIYSLSVVQYDPKFFAELKNSGIKILSYPETLGIVTADKCTIAVSGTHGKTTTTAMIAKVLIEAKKDPSVIVGSLLKDSKSNLVVGKSEFFVVEACEYKRAFLNINPRILVITNIESDHLDYYKDFNDIKNAFGQLVLQTKGAVVYNGNDTNISVLVCDYKGEIINYSKYLEKVPKLSVPGAHNRINAAAAMAVADILNINEEVTKKALSEFSGTWRRLDKKGITREGAIIYDDYAHHPTEIKASLDALRELYPKNEKKIIVLFQPHLYSRTKALFDDFAKSFKEADQLLLLPIYFAREAKDESISSDKLAEAIKKNGVKVEGFQDFTTAETHVRALNLGKNNVFVTMGAGEAYKVSDSIFKLS